MGASVSLQLPPSDSGSDEISLFRICDDMDDDVKIARACRLAAWGQSDEGRDEDAVALYKLIEHVVDRLEERRSQAVALHNAERASP